MTQCWTKTVTELELQRLLCVSVVRTRSQLCTCFFTAVDIHMPEHNLVILINLDDFCISSKNTWSARDKTRILLAPPFEDNISKRDNFILKDALWQHRQEIMRTYCYLLLLTSITSSTNYNKPWLHLWLCQVLRLYLLVVLLPVWNSARIGSIRNQEEEELNSPNVPSTRPQLVINSSCV